MMNCKLDNVNTDLEEELSGLPEVLLDDESKIEHLNTLVDRVFTAFRDACKGEEGTISEEDHLLSQIQACAVDYKENQECSARGFLRLPNMVELVCEAAAKAKVVGLANQLGKGASEQLIISLFEGKAWPAAKSFVLEATNVTFLKLQEHIDRKFKHYPAAAELVRREAKGMFAKLHQEAEKAVKAIIDAHTNKPELLHEILYLSFSASLRNKYDEDLQAQGGKEVALESATVLPEEILNEQVENMEYDKFPGLHPRRSSSCAP